MHITATITLVSLAGDARDERHRARCRRWCRRLCEALGWLFFRDADTATSFYFDAMPHAAIRYFASDADVT